ncbi:hypothetical protein [Escherichia coli]|uniref:hypothetical protein n=1 Tax=Escherichia coli TaxID=562 RepID=UPI0022261F3B|nr:hypothetical protein [Escherichia coli]MCW3365107.1 hypothetical protein [Escherichia coli]
MKTKRDELALAIPERDAAYTPGMMLGHHCSPCTSASQATKPQVLYLTGKMLDTSPARSDPDKPGKEKRSR